METKRKLGQLYLHQKKIDFKTATTIKEGHWIMIKGSTQREDIIFVNIYVPNIRAPKSNTNINRPKG